MNLLGFNNYIDFVNEYLIKEEHMNSDQLRNTLKHLIWHIVFPTGDFNIFMASCEKETEELNYEPYQQIRNKLKEKKLLLIENDQLNMMSFEEIKRIVNLKNEFTLKDQYISISKINSMKYDDLKKHIHELINLTISLIHKRFIILPYQINLIGFEVIYSMKNKKILPKPPLKDDNHPEWFITDYDPFIQIPFRVSFKLKPRYKNKQTEIKDAIIQLDRQLPILHEDFVIDDFNAILFSEDFSSCKEIQFDIHNNQVSRLFEILDEYFEGTILSTVHDSQKFRSKSKNTLLKRSNIDSAKNKNPYIKHPELFDDFKRKLQRIG